MSWSSLLLPWPFHIHIVVLLAPVLGCQLANATKDQYRTFVVDSSNLDARITYSDGSWSLVHDDPSAGVYYFGGSTMRTFSNGDSVEFVFTGPSVRPPPARSVGPSAAHAHHARVLAGNAVAVFGDVGTTHASFSVEVDGRAAEEGTAYSASGFQTEVQLWRKVGLQEGEHRLRITHDDVSGLWLSVDRFQCVASSSALRSWV
jgi:hypothetical protein